MTAPTIQTGIRAASLGDLATLLQDLHARKVDIVAPAETIHAQTDGLLRVEGVEPVLSDEGVTLANGLYLPTNLAQGQLGDALGVPQAYLRRLAATFPELWAENVNGWLSHETYRGKSYLVRALRGDDGSGIARAFLSSRYRVIDNLDVLMSALDGIREATTTQIDIHSADLTDSRMYVKVWAPEIAQEAETLLAGYRSPFNFGEKRAGDDRVWTSAGPVVFAGFVISNSEVGGGAFSIAPQVIVRTCLNGMTITRDALRKTHLGGRLEDGVIDWSDTTQDAALALIKAQTTDAVRTFLSPEYLATKVTELEAVAGVPVNDPPKAIELVAKKLAYGKDRQDDLLRHFTLGGQLTAGGVAQAMTSLAQVVEDADEAYRLEADAVTAMELVAAIR